MLLRKLWYAFAMIFNRQRIPTLPRGMLASEYDDVNGEERRVMARLGSRDFIGVKRAMRQAGVKTVDELVDTLDHQQPERQVMHRVYLGFGRIAGGTEYDPHQIEILEDERQRKKLAAQKEIIQRIKITKNALK